MNRIRKKLLLQMLVSFLIGRVVFFERNPIGAAYFAAGFVQGGMTFPVVVSLCLGILSAFRVETVIRYGAAMMAVVVAVDLLRIKEQPVKMGHCAIVMAASLAVLSAAQYILLPFQTKDIIFAIAEVILVLTFTRILYEGQKYYLHHKRGQTMSHEQLISLLVIGIMAVYGLPNVMIADISLPEMVVYFFLPLMAYQYGPGIGAVAGAAGGTLLVLTGQESSVIGTLCLLGICCGMLRRQGKVWMLSAYIVVSVMLGVLLEGQMMAAGTLKSVVIDSVVFLFLPDKWMRKLRLPTEGVRDTLSAEQVQRTVQHKLRGFSDAFGQLSRVLEKQSREKTGISRHDVRLLMQEMSQEVCERCENREQCMGHIALGRPDSIGQLVMAQEQGNLVLEQMPVEFMEECVHPEWFLTETNHGLNMARTIMGFQNRLAQNRQILAGQMEQVGTLMEELAGEIERSGEVSQELEISIKREFAGMHVRVDELEIYEDREGHMQICMTACTYKGKLVTTREAASVLADLTDRPLIPTRESRSVIPRQWAQISFEEDTPLYAVVGVARTAKEGEEVSGDTFSCLPLPGGELLLALSDGMGSGEDALEESQTVIELLEQMTEAGFSKLSALKLINSLYMPEEEEAHFATADVVVLDLYQGSCQFIKNGAAATWLRRGDCMESIEGQALPIGVMWEAEPYLEKTQISSGDYVIMMTDGVSDAFLGREEEWERWLQEERIINPQELAQAILDQAVAACGGRAQDDMSVIAAGIWQR